MAQLSATISDKNKQHLEDEADAEKRTVSGQIDYILEKRYTDSNEEGSQ